jgi:hypothetical protein
MHNVMSAFAQIGNLIVVEDIFNLEILRKQNE